MGDDDSIAEVNEPTEGRPEQLSKFVRAVDPGGSIAHVWQITGFVVVIDNDKCRTALRIDDEEPACHAQIVDELTFFATQMGVPNAARDGSILVKGIEVQIGIVAVKLQPGAILSQQETARVILAEVQIAVSEE